MAVPFDTAINAYSNTAKTFSGLGQGAGGADATGGASFGSVLQDAIQGAIDVEHNSEQVSAKALVGKASANDVVFAVSQAEVTMKEVTAIRDKVVAAYEDIIKMPI